MCNAWNHSDGCRCGFGPPYDEVNARIVRLSEEVEPGRVVAELSVWVPLQQSTRYWRLPSDGRQLVERSLERTLQRVADDRFGSRVLRVKVAGARKGSIEYSVVLIPVVAIYKFIKDYPTLKKGIKEFCGDIRRWSRHLQIKIRGAMRRAERRRNERTQPRIRESKGI